MNWYCVHTRPGKETLVELCLKEQLHLETYFPRLRRPKRIRGVKRMVTEPLFPRYLFCRFDPAMSYRAVRYGKDIIGIVHTGDLPAIVSDDTILHLKSWAGQDETILTVASDDPKPGDKVVIASGPMQGLEAIFLSDTKRSERVAILLNWMNAPVKTEIDRAILEPKD